MDSFISFSSWRREPWKGHESAKEVRAAIRYARRMGRADLRIFELDDTANLVVTYWEVVGADWDRVFFPAKPEA